MVGWGDGEAAKMVAPGEGGKAVETAGAIAGSAGTDPDAAAQPVSRIAARQNNPKAKHWGLWQVLLRVSGKRLKLIKP